MPKTHPITFASRLRTLREAAGLTQAELAEASGVGQSAISLIEAGKRPAPGWDTVVKLAKALKVDICTSQF